MGLGGGLEGGLVIVEGYDRLASVLGWRPTKADELAADNLYIWDRIERGWYAQRDAHEAASADRLDIRVRIEAKASAIVMFHATFERAVKFWVVSWRDDPLMPQDPTAYRVQHWEEIDDTMRGIRGIGFNDLQVGVALNTFRQEANRSRHADGEQQRQEYGRLGDDSIQTGLWAVRRFWSSVLLTYRSRNRSGRIEGPA